jgi:hypothetical protein
MLVDYNDDDDDDNDDYNVIKHTYKSVFVGL